jgi:hypothetical protein
LKDVLAEALGNRGGEGQADDTSTTETPAGGGVTSGEGARSTGAAGAGPAADPTGGVRKITRAELADPSGKARPRTPTTRKPGTRKPGTSKGKS